MYWATKCVSQILLLAGNQFSWQTLYHWIDRSEETPKPRKKKVIINMVSHWAIPLAMFELKTIKRSYEEGETVSDIAKEPCQTIYF